MWNVYFFSNLFIIYMIKIMFSVKIPVMDNLLAGISQLMSSGMMQSSLAQIESILCNSVVCHLYCSCTKSHSYEPWPYCAAVQTQPIIFYHSVWLFFSSAIAAFLLAFSAANITHYFTQNEANKSLFSLDSVIRYAVPLSPKAKLVGDLGRNPSQEMQG